MVISTRFTDVECQFKNVPAGILQGQGLRADSHVGLGFLAVEGHFECLKPGIGTVEQIIYVNILTYMNR